MLFRSVLLFIHSKIFSKLSIYLYNLRSI